jgi:hypothetical protein
MESNF